VTSSGRGIYTSLRSSSGHSSQCGLFATTRRAVAHDDDALWRRLLRLPFENVIPSNKRDKNLRAILTDPHLTGPAVLKWAVEGCVEWYRNGLQIPGSVRPENAAGQACLLRRGISVLESRERRASRLRAATGTAHPEPRSPPRCSAAQAGEARPSAVVEGARRSSGRADCGLGLFRRALQCGAIVREIGETTDGGNGSWDRLARPFIPSVGPGSKVNVGRQGVFIRRVFKHLQPDSTRWGNVRRMPVKAAEASRNSPLPAGPFAGMIHLEAPFDPILRA
jgi:hypothetical protein